MDTSALTPRRHLQKAFPDLVVQVVDKGRLFAL